jgi:exonuclease SbcD
MKILHTSDIQLDAPFLFLGKGGKRHRKQLRDTFASVLEMAQTRDYQMLLVAGDLFNSNRPLQSTVDSVIRLLGKLSIPVCVLPGNHDPYDATSIYRRTVFPSNVTIFHDGVKAKMFPELDCAVYGNAVTSKAGEGRPLVGIQPHLEARWHIAMAHGNIVTGLVHSPDRPIQPGEIAGCGMHYLALGDWHSYADHSQGSVQAFYSGAPEPMGYDQEGAGFVASVILDEEGVQVEKTRVGKIRAQQVNMNISGHNEAEILDLIMEYAGEENMVDVVLSGITELSTFVDSERMEMLLSPHFYTIRVRDESHPRLSDISTVDYPPEHIISRFIEVMKDQIHQATDIGSACLAEQALQIGVALLEGKDVI